MNEEKDDRVDDTFEAMLERAKAGDVIAAKQSLAWMADALATTAPVPKEIRTFLAQALWTIAHKDADANEALHIKISNRPPKHDYVDLRRAAIMMRCYMDCIDETTGKKFIKKAAAKRAASEYNTSQKKHLPQNSKMAPNLTPSAVTAFYDANAHEIDAEYGKCFDGTITKIQ